MKVNLSELARMITKNGWVCDEYKDDKPNPYGDFTVDVKGMREFVDSWIYAPDQDGILIPMSYFANNEVEKGHTRAIFEKKTMKKKTHYPMYTLSASGEVSQIIIKQDLVDFEKYREQENKKAFKNRAKFESYEDNKKYMSELETREIPDTISEFIKFLEVRKG